MKILLQGLYAIVLGLLTAVTGLAGPGEPPGAVTTGGQQMGGRPLAEMMLYEAAEQAVEDGYGRIIHESEPFSTEKEATETVDDTISSLPAPASSEEQGVE